MPRNILRVVAILIGLSAVGGLVLGILGTPEKSHLPGEAPGSAPSAPLTASELLPLDEEPVPPPPEPEKPKEEVLPKQEQAPAEAAPPVMPPPANPVVPKPPVVEDQVGDLLDGVTPPPAEDPPH
jgi:uncharacterized membrane protein